MNARACGLIATLTLLTCSLLLILTGALAPRAAAAPALTQDARPPDATRIRLEGYLKATGPGKWLVGEWNISVDRETIVIEKHGKAEVGAWVSVWGIRDENGTIYGELIQVERPVDRSKPVIQFSGLITKQAGPLWIINDMLVEVTENTQITGTPALGWLVWVVAEVQPTQWRALAIEAIADTPAAVPVEFEGVLEAYGAGGGQVDGRPFILIPNPVIIGEPVVGDEVEVRATRNENGDLLVHVLRVIDPSAEAFVNARIMAIRETGDGEQIWGVLIFPQTPWAEPISATLHVDRNTRVDESRAVMKPGLWAEIRGDETGQGEIHAEAIYLDRPVPVTIAGQLEPASGTGWWQIDGEPVWLDPAQQVSAAAFAGGQYSLKGVRLGNGVIWAERLRAQSAPAATDDSSAATAPWSAPTPVASGLTDAAQPVLAYTGDGTAHALWESRGHIYYAFRAPGQNWSQPERIAAGMEPAMTVDSLGRLHAVFANQFLDNYDIYHTVRVEGEWTLPVNLAHTTGVSMSPGLAADGEGRLHVTWMDNSPEYWVTYAAIWTDSFWSNQPVPNARGQSPAIAVAQDGKVFLAWQDRVPTPDNPTGSFAILLSEQQEKRWSVPIDISDCEGVDAIGVSLTTTADGLAHLVWLEGGQTVRYDFGAGLYWPLPQTVVRAAVFARGPRIANADGNYLYVAWDEGEVLRATAAPKAPAAWPKPEVVTSLLGILKDVGISVEQGKGVTLTWVQTSQAGDTGIYESRYEKPFRFRTWAPIMSAD